MTTNDSPTTSAHLQSLYAPTGGVTAVFAAKASDYAAARPDYPPGVLEVLAAALAAPGVAHPPQVVDLGAGTGLLTRGLLGRGWSVCAVEPNDAMRAEADAALAPLAGYRSLAGRAESMPLPDASADLITAAQAFHWFEPEAARRECQRVLRPGGQVALIWNDRCADDPLQQALNAVFAAFGGERRTALLAHDQHNDRERLQAFYGHAAFTQHRFDHTQGLDRTGLRCLVFSRSYMPAPDSEAGAAAVAAVDTCFDRHQTNGRVYMRYSALVIIGALT